jgi:hypothetical protein
MAGDDFGRRLRPRTPPYDLFRPRVERPPPPGPPIHRYEPAAAPPVERERDHRPSIPIVRYEDEMMHQQQHHHHHHAAPQPPPPAPRQAPPIVHAPSIAPPPPVVVRAYDYGREPRYMKQSRSTKSRSQYHAEHNHAAQNRAVTESRRYNFTPDPKTRTFKLETSTEETRLQSSFHE